MFPKSKDVESLRINELFKQVTSCSAKNIQLIINRTLPNLVDIINKYDFSTVSSISQDDFTLMLWTSISLVFLVKAEQKEIGRDNEVLKKKVENEHKGNMKIMVHWFKNNNVFLQDYFSFITQSGLWNNYRYSNYLLLFLPRNFICIDEFIINICAVLVYQYNKKNRIELNNILNIASFMILNEDWVEPSHIQKCIKILIHFFEYIYENNVQEDMKLMDSLFSWNFCLIERINNPDHVAEIVDILSLWLYLHAVDEYQIVNVGSLLHFCCDYHHPFVIHLSFKHFFQDVILCMINSNNLNIVYIGYDILITMIDHLGNKRLFVNPKLYRTENVSLLKKHNGETLNTKLFSRDDFICMIDSIHKVMINSINRFINNVVIARKVNIVVSLLVVEGSESAQGLTSVISFALNVQHSMLEMCKKKLKHIPLSQDSYLPDPNISFYHASVASWFSLLSNINKDDLDLFRNYVTLVIELRKDSAPYLLPSEETVPFLSYYIYEIDKSLFFDIDKIQGAIESSWVILTNDKDLLNNIKIPRSDVLVEKYVDLLWLDSFDSYRVEDKTDSDQSLTENSLEIDGVSRLFTDAENRYSEAFTEPFNRYIFE